MLRKSLQALWTRTSTPRGNVSPMRQAQSVYTAYVSANSPLQAQQEKLQREIQTNRILFLAEHP